MSTHQRARGKFSIEAMTQFEIFIFGCMNFAILIAIIAWGLRKTVRRFLYARSAVLKKQMVAAARERREARARLLKDRRNAETLEEDIAQRRSVMAASCQNECARVFDEARQRASGIVDAAARQVQDEAAQATAKARRLVLEDAFRRAEKILRDGMTSEERRRVVELGLEELDDIVRERAGEAAAEGAR